MDGSIDYLKNLMDFVKVCKLPKKNRIDDKYQVTMIPAAFDYSDSTVSQGIPSY